jgi:hypothetical protein
MPFLLTWYYSVEDYEHGAILVIRATVQWPEGRVVLTMVVADRSTSLGTGPSASRPVWRFWGSRVLRTVRYCTVQVQAKVPKEYVQYNCCTSTGTVFHAREDTEWSCTEGLYRTIHMYCTVQYEDTVGDATATATDELQEQRGTGDV